MPRTRIAKVAAVAPLLVAAVLALPAATPSSGAPAAGTASLLADDAGWQVAPADAGWQ